MDLNSDSNLCPQLLGCARRPKRSAISKLRLWLENRKSDAILDEQMGKLWTFRSAHSKTDLVIPVMKIGTIAKMAMAKKSNSMQNTSKWKVRNNK